MIHLLYGEDDYSLREHLASIKEQVKPPDLRDVNTAILDGAETSLDELTATCDTVPFLAEKRLVVVEGLLSLFERRAPSRSAAGGSSDQRPGLDRWQQLPEYLARVPESTDLVFVDGRLTGANRLLAAIRPHATVRTFPRPDVGGLRQWIRNRAAAQGIEIEPRAVDTLADTVGSDLRTLAVELEKLAVYRRGRPIQEEDVRALVSYTREANIFAAVDAIMEGRPDAAMRQVHSLLQASSPPAYILAMLARQVRLLVLAKDLRARRVPSAEQGRRMGLHGYPLRKTLEQEGRFSAGQLVAIHRKLLEADVSMKTTGVDEELILDLLIADIASGSTGGPAMPVARPRR